MTGGPRTESHCVQDRKTPLRRLRIFPIGSAAAVLFLAPALAPSPADAQVLNLLRAIGDGGSWVKLPVEEGRASYRSPALPVAGIAVNGCVRVWVGNKGAWTLRAQDLLGEAKLAVTTEPDKPVKFEFKAGFQAQLDLEVEWSESGDTDLYLWVGLALKQDPPPEESEEDERDICEPPPP